ncbi:MAG TPA: UDP-3-O-acyl-N-acetylglucosamine deacetylase [Steroidobacteraceae bacterium]|nr:UDP-3-O-acyl-N-acetylglucosamine deacetylase [Steroidobacteraceae bacterium]
MFAQRTLKTPIGASGVGLHSGARISMTLQPAPPDTGIVFRRGDLDPPIDIPARAALVGETRLGTVLAVEGARVSTIEHLMSAFAGLGVDNAIVEVSAAEVPIMDGSAAPFVFLLQSAGFVEQDRPKRFMRILHSVEVRDGDKWARFDPHEGFRVNFEIDFDHPLLRSGQTVATMDFSSVTYLKEVARARTFGFMRDIEALRRHNLALGGTLDNAIVLDDAGIMNEEGLRYRDEFVKHKILDAIGDLYLLGHGIIGAFSGYKSGHGLNNRLLRELLARADAWELVSFASSAEAPIAYAQLGAEAYEQEEYDEESY